MTAKVHKIVMVPGHQLHEHPDNTQKQSKHEFEGLRESIRSGGFDESLIVVPKEDGDGYWIISGNHRYRAGMLEGITDFPVVIRDDWDNIKSQMELVRRNYQRGSIDSTQFTNLVNRLVTEESVSIYDIQRDMGFESDTDFETLYRRAKEKEDKETGDAVRDTQNSNAGMVKMIDDLGFVISAILEKYGDTVPYSFIIFPTGGKNHMFIAANPTLKKSLEAVAEACVGQHLDMNVALAGLIQIGIANTNFLKGQGKQEVLSQNEVDGDSDLATMIDDDFTEDDFRS